MAAEREEESFKVTDRRRKVDEEEDTSSSPAEPERRAPESAPRPTEPTATTAPQAGGAEQPPRDLTGLFLMFASSALVAMGEAPHPQDGSVERDLDAAAEAIDMLMLLREKTEGRRSPEEEQLLGHILYDLQLRFVQARKTPRS